MNIYTIYKATNKINGKHYIGFDSKFPSRKSSHKNSLKTTTNNKFHRAIKKYGWDNFEWEILYQSKDLDHTKNEMEKFFITEFDSYYKGYNSTFGGEGTFGYIRSLEQKKEIGKATSERNIGRFWYNNGIENKFCHIPPDENWKRGRLNQKPTTEGNKWYNNGKEQKLTKNPPTGWIEGMLPKSEETKLKISISKLGKPSKNKGIQNPKSYKRIMTPKGEFESVKAAAKYFNRSPATISNRLKFKPNDYYHL